VSDLSPGAVEHLVPVVEIVVLLGGAVVAVIVTGYAGFRWLRGQIKESFQSFTTGPDFRRVVSEIITEATAGWNDINNRLHEEHRRSFTELRKRDDELAKRDDERAEAIKRLHGRVDSVWERVGQK
jgi:hypothetical protein